MEAQVHMQPGGWPCSIWIRPRNTQRYELKKAEKHKTYRAKPGATAAGFVSPPRVGYVTGYVRIPFERPPRRNGWWPPCLPLATPPSVPGRPKDGGCAA